MKMICPNCMAENSEGCSVCEYCGTPLAAAGAQPPQPAQPQAMPQPAQPQAVPMRPAARNENPLRVYCKNCGSPAGFDIIAQTYRCAACGTMTGIQEAQSRVANWKTLQKESVQAPSAGQGLEAHSCPSCGAEVMFAPGEASEGCAFCGSKLVRHDFTSAEEMPDLIIPFFLTPAEAKERMLAWGQAHEKTPEGKQVLSEIGQLKGYYLPYRVVRGPVQARVSRDGTLRTYDCAGFLEGCAVNTSKQLDNLVLNDMEPFDWSAARAFEYGYIAGQPVKMNDTSDSEIEERIREEVKEDFLPEVEKVMQTSGVQLEMATGNISVLSALLPVYFIRSGNLTAVLNGQTGRIAVSTERKKKSVPWVIEPLIYTILLTLFMGALLQWHPEGLFYSVCIFGAIMFTLFGNGRNSLIRRISMRSDAARAKRQDGELVIDEAKDILKNPYDNTPVFYERDTQGRMFPVRIRFYTVGRWISSLINSLVTIFLPVFIAAPLRLAEMEEGEAFSEGFHLEYGAVWYIIAGFIVMLYLTQGMRQDVYDHPYLYAIGPDGSQRLIGKRADRKVTVLSIFGLGTYDENGQRVTLFRWIKAKGKSAVAILVMLTVFLLGSVATMLS